MNIRYVLLLVVAVVTLNIVRNANVAGTPPVIPVSSAPLAVATEEQHDSTPGDKPETPSPQQPRPTAPAKVTGSDSCVESSSFTPLGEFKFFGKMMNVSSPCPTAGRSNQFMMILGLMQCAKARKETLRWKDISCTPTGGKAGRSTYRVGSDDYVYAWFRWSELFEVVDKKAVCFADSFSWSENGPWMKKCPTTVDHFYGRPDFWSLLRSLRVHPWYYRLLLDFLATENIPGASEAAERAATGDAGTLPFSGIKYLSIHVRRGDYGGFCKQTGKGSGKTKFLTPPFKWLRHNSTSMSSRFGPSCFPSDDNVISGIKTAIEKAKEAVGEEIKHLLLATNSPTLADVIRKSLPGLTVMSLKSYLKDQSQKGADQRVYHSYWPRPELTSTEEDFLDTVAMSMASSVILNRYSTFSQAAIDFRMLREGSLNGMLVNWW